jgi:FkbH-like protein
MYREQALRREALSAEFDYPQMMAALQLKVRFSRAMPGDMERITELVQRTNQFNTTTIRYTKQQLTAMRENPSHRIYVAELSDKFGSLGLVAVAVVARSGADATIESFVMSCRAMGFQLEHLIIALLLEAEADAHRFIGRFVATDRNTPAMNLFSSCGFHEQGDATFAWQRGETEPPRPAWFAVSSR